MAPVKTGLVASPDYAICKAIVESLEIGETQTIEIEDYKRCQKYIYEIGLKMKPKRREFSTKKLSLTELKVTRVKSNDEIDNQ